MDKDLSKCTGFRNEELLSSREPNMKRTYLVSDWGARDHGNRTIKLYCEKRLKANVSLS